MLTKKIIGIFVSTVTFLNIGMPIFAYSSANQHILPNNTFEVHVSKEIYDDELMNINLGDEKISLSLNRKTLNSERSFVSEKVNKSDKLTKGQTQEIEGVLPEVSVRYKSQKQGLKEDFILHSKNAQNVFDLNYDIGSLEAKQLNEQNILLLDKKIT